MAELFESYERRLPQINAKLAEYGISSIEEAEKITKDAGLDVYHLIEGIQPICFENAKWAYTVGAAIAIKKNCRRAADAAAAIGEGLRLSAFPVLLLTDVRLVLVTVTSVRCSSKKIQSASHS